MKIILLLICLVLSQLTACTVRPYAPPPVTPATDEAIRTMMGPIR